MLRINGLYSLRIQSLIVTASMGILITALLFFYTLPEQSRWINESLSQASERSLSQLSSSITPTLLTRQYAELYDNVDSHIKNHSNWFKIKITEHPSGRQIYPLEKWSDDLKDGDILLDQKIFSLDETIGHISLIVNFNKEIIASSKLHYTLTAILLCMVVVVFMLLIVLVDKNVTLPLRKLKIAYKKLADGQYNFPLPESNTEEINSVIQEFDDMRCTVNAYQNNLRELRLKAEMANKAKTAFLSSMSHELRTPLNAILGLAQLAQYDPAVSDEHKSNTKSIYQAGEHLLALINDVLDLTTIETGNIKLSIQEFSIKEKINECIYLVNPIAKQAQITIDDRQISTFNDVKLNTDPRRLNQSLLNLFSNAIKYNKHQGSVTVECHCPRENTIRISITDTGPGIDENKLERLFTPFDRLGAEAGKEPGTGIGLVITKQLIELMGGEIGVESLGHSGTTFWLEFPIVEHNQSIPVSPIDKEKKHGINLKNKSTIRILVAEDQPTNQKVIEQQLRLLGHSATFVADGAEALQQLKAHTYDLLLTDIQMPNLDGFGLAKNIREYENSKNKQLVIIAITANATESNIQNCYKLGMNDVLCKPVELHSLNKIIDTHFPSCLQKELYPGNLSNKNSSQGCKDGKNSLTILFDIECLANTVGDEHEIHCMMIDVFKGTTPEQCHSIEKAITEKNLKSISFHAHGLKSSARSIGALQLAELCEELEHKANLEEIELCLPYKEQLSVCFKETLMELDQYYAKY